VLLFAGGIQKSSYYGERTRWDPFFFSFFAFIWRVQIYDFNLQNLWLDLV
jgi:hypothetical protein